MRARGGGGGKRWVGGWFAKLCIYACTWAGAACEKRVLALSPVGCAS